MKRLFFYLTIALVIISCNTQKTIQVMHVRQMEAEAGHTGFYYALPRTVLSIDVTVKKTEYTPGPFAPYAERLLGLKDVIKNKSVVHELAGINISNYAEPDPLQFYFVKYDDEVFENKPFYISFSESGLIKSVNTKFDSDEFMQAIDGQDEYGYFGSQSTFNYFIDHNLEEKIDTIFEMIKKDTSMVERHILQRSWVEKDMETRAREVTDFILKLRNQKMDLISGFHEIPYSKETIEYMHTEMKEIEKDYLDLFTGIKSTSYISYRYNYLPEKSEVNTAKPIFRFSSEEGVLPASQRDKGIPVTIELKRNETTRQPEVFINRNINPQIPGRGFYYRIPEHANVTLKKGNNIKAEARLLINQFGTITYLPPDHLEVEFYPNTGFIKSSGKLDIISEDQ